eukprot:1241267-Rhodomonas_salina.2
MALARCPEQHNALAQSALSQYRTPHSHALLEYRTPHSHSRSQYRTSHCITSLRTTDQYCRSYSHTLSRTQHCKHDRGDGLPPDALRRAVVAAYAMSVPDMAKRAVQYCCGRYSTAAVRVYRALHSKVHIQTATEVCYATSVPDIA